MTQIMFMPQRDDILSKRQVTQWTAMERAEDCANKNMQGSLSQCDEWHSGV
jgi:hypothetical protein